MCDYGLVEGASSLEAPLVSRCGCCLVGLDPIVPTCTKGIAILCLSNVNADYTH